MTNKIDISFFEKDIYYQVHRRNKGVDIEEYEQLSYSAFSFFNPATSQLIKLMDMMLVDYSWIKSFYLKVEYRKSFSECLWFLSHFFQ